MIMNIEQSAHHETCFVRRDLLLLAINYDGRCRNACREAAVLGPEPALFVSTSGNDAWSGHLPPMPRRRTVRLPRSGPRGFVDPGRFARRNRTRKRPIVVAIRGGTYWLTEPIVFSPEDSGTEQAARSLPGLRRRAADFQRRARRDRLADRRKGPLERGTGGRGRGAGLLRNCSSTTSGDSARGCPKGILPKVARSIRR